MSASFAEQYKHPKWQRKRLEILERAGYACESCEARDKELHVHHTYYERNRKPWEYPNESLECLCVVCHGEETEARRELMRAIRYLDGPMMLEVAGFAQALSADYEKLRGPIEILSAEHMDGIAAYFSLWVDRSERVLATERALWDHVERGGGRARIPDLAEWIDSWRSAWWREEEKKRRPICNDPL